MGISNGLPLQRASGSPQYCGTGNPSVFINSFCGKRQRSGKFPMYHPPRRASSRSAQGHLRWLWEQGPPGHLRRLWEQGQPGQQVIEAISLFLFIFTEHVLGRGTWAGKGYSECRRMLAFLPVQRAPPSYHCQGIQGAWSKSGEVQLCHSESSLSSRCLIYPDLWISKPLFTRKKTLAF